MFQGIRMLAMRCLNLPAWTVYARIYNTLHYNVMSKRCILSGVGTVAPALLASL